MTKLWKWESFVRGSGLRARFARALAWSAGGTIVSRILTLGAAIGIARLLGKTAYGEFGIIQSTIGTFGIVAGFGLGATATKYVAQLRHADPVRVGRIISMSSAVAACMGGTLSLALLALAPVIATGLLGAPHLTGPLRVGALVLFLSALDGAQSGALAGFESFRLLARVNLISGLLGLPAMVGGAWIGGVDGAVWGMAAYQASRWMLNGVALRSVTERHRIKPRMHECYREWRVLLRFSIPAALGSLIVAPVNWAGGALLVNGPGGYPQMGLYSAATQWRSAILVIPGMISRIALPMLSNLGGTDADREYRRVLRGSLWLNLLIASAVAAPLLLLADWVMAAYGSGYVEAANVLRIVVIGSVLITVNGIIGQAIASKGQMWIGLAFNILQGAVMLPFAIIFIRQGQGALGLALAVLISYTCHTIWQLFYLKKLMQASPSETPLTCSGAKALGNAG